MTTENELTEQAIQRCREAIHDHDDMLSVADRSDFSELLAAYDRAAKNLADLLDAVQSFRHDLLKRWQPAPHMGGEEHWPPPVARLVRELDAAVAKAREE